MQRAGWGVGPLMAQTAHATAAVLHETRERAETRAYLEDLRNMRKVHLRLHCFFPAFLRACTLTENRLRRSSCRFVAYRTKTLLCARGRLTLTDRWRISRL